MIIYENKSCKLHSIDPIATQYIEYEANFHRHKYKNRPKIQKKNKINE